MPQAHFARMAGPTQHRSILTKLSTGQDDLQHMPSFEHASDASGDSSDGRASRITSVLRADIGWFLVQGEHERALFDGLPITIDRKDNN